MMDGSKMVNKRRANDNEEEVSVANKTATSDTGTIATARTNEEVQPVSKRIKREDDVSRCDDYCKSRASSPSVDISSPKTTTRSAVDDFELASALALASLANFSAAPPSTAVTSTAAGATRTLEAGRRSQQNDQQQQGLKPKQQVLGTKTSLEASKPSSDWDNVSLQDQEPESNSSKRNNNFSYSNHESNKDTKDAPPRQSPASAQEEEQEHAFIRPGHERNVSNVSMGSIISAAEQRQDDLYYTGDGPAPVTPDKKGIHLQQQQQQQQRRVHFAPGTEEHSRRRHQMIQRLQLPSGLPAPGYPYPPPPPSHHHSHHYHHPRGTGYPFSHYPPHPHQPATLRVLEPPSSPSPSPHHLSSSMHRMSAPYHHHHHHLAAGSRQHSWPPAPGTASAAAFMPPPPSTRGSAGSGANCNTEGPQQQKQQPWVCDYCHVASFATYREACQHEDSCDHKPRGGGGGSGGTGTATAGDSSSAAVIRPSFSHPPGSHHSAAASMHHHQYGPYNSQHHPRAQLEAPLYHHPRAAAFAPLNGPPASLASYHHRLAEARSKAITRSNSAIFSPSSSSSSKNRGAWFQGCISLAIPQKDSEWLSPLECFIRREWVQAFSAQQHHVTAASPRQRLTLNQVGIRCRFCPDNPEATNKEEWFASFPASLSGIYEVVQKWQITHSSCPYMPDDVREQLKKLRQEQQEEQHQKGIREQDDDATRKERQKDPTDTMSVRQYWIDSAKALGMVDTLDGIRFAKDMSLGSKVSQADLEELDNSMKFLKIPPPLPSSSSHTAGAAGIDVYDSSLVVRHSSQGASSSLASGESIVFESDEVLVPPYVHFLMSQVEKCWFTEADRFVARSKGPIGYAGFQCRHCHGHAGLGKYFPVTSKSLSTNSTSQNIHAHLLKCRTCPVQVKSRLIALKEEKSKAPRLEPGWRRIFFEKIWGRLHDGSDNNEHSQEEEP